MHDGDPARIAAALFALALFAPAVAASGAEAEGGALTREDVARLERGEVLLRNQVDKDAKGRGRGRAIVLIRRPPAAVWTVLTDYEKHTEFMPGVVRSKVYSRADRTVGVAYTLKVLLKSIRYHCLCTAAPDQRAIRWTLDKSRKNDIAGTTGCWEIRPHGDGGSIAIYSLAVDTGMSVPRFVQNFLTRRDLPNVARALKKRVESARP